jgi:hypothetical protein
MPMFLLLTNIISKTSMLFHVIFHVLTSYIFLYYNRKQIFQLNM